MKDILNKYPEDIQELVREVLKAYNSCNILEGPQSVFSVMTCNILSVDTEDLVGIETITARQVYTEDEIMENYINEFYEYPINYTGPRDYKKLAQAKEDNRKYALNVFNELVLI